MVKEEHLRMVEDLFQRFLAEYVWIMVKPMVEDLHVLSVSPE